MAKRAVKYAVIDAFTNTPFKGNPAAVCFLEEEDEGKVDEEWMQSVAKEFNISQTSFLTRTISGANPRFNLRWFTPVTEVKLCGHGTIAAAHFLLTSGIAKGDMIEFVTKSGLLTATKVNRFSEDTSVLSNGKAEEDFSIELDFPMISVLECDDLEILSIPKTLNGLSMVKVLKTATAGDFIVELASGEDVANIQPNFDEIEKCPGRGIIITGPAPTESEFDFISRFFCPKFGINEDPVCGSAHCALAPYWSKKLGKQSLTAYMASPRGGRLDLQLDEETERVRMRGPAVTIMAGTLFV